MSDVVTADPRLRARKVAVAREAGRRRLRILLLASLVPGLLVVSLLVLLSPLLSARHVSVSGAGPTPVATVLEVTGLDRHPPLADIDPGKDAAILERLPWVGSARVTLHWPFSVSVSITARSAVAAVADGASTSAVLDVTGRVLALVASSSRLAGGLVDISWSAPIPAPGGSLGAGARGELAVARALPRALRPAVRFVADRAGSGVVIQLRSGPLVLIGRADQLGAKMISLETILHSVSLAGTRTIDLSVPTIPVLTQ